MLCMVKNITGRVSWLPATCKTFPSSSRRHDLKRRSVLPAFLGISTGHRWIPIKKSYREYWCFICCHSDESLERCQICFVICRWPVKHQGVVLRYYIPIHSDACIDTTAIPCIWRSAVLGIRNIAVDISHLTKKYTNISSINKNQLHITRYSIHDIYGNKWWVKLSNF